MPKLGAMYISALASVIIALVASYAYTVLIDHNERLARDLYIILLDPREVYAVTREGPRPGIEISGTWEISSDIAKEAISEMPQIQNSVFIGWQGEDVLSTSTDQYYYQLSGVLSKGIKYVHINAVHRDGSLSEYIQKIGYDKALIVNDGGGYYWSAMYQPSNKKFSHLYINGKG